jgi:hypothetical protein
MTVTPAGQAGASLLGPHWHCRAARGPTKSQPPSQAQPEQLSGLRDGPPPRPGTTAACGWRLSESCSGESRSPSRTRTQMKMLR